MNSLENSLAPILLPLSSLRLFQLPRATRLALEMLDRLQGDALAVELQGAHARGASIVDWRREGGGPDKANILLRYDQARFEALIEAALAAG